MIPEDEPSDKLYKKEEIEMQLDKIPIIEAEVKALINELTVQKKRITNIQKEVIRLQDQKEDIKCK